MRYVLCPRSRCRLPPLYPTYRTKSKLSKREPDHNSVRRMLHGMWGDICIPGIAYVFYIKKLLIRCMGQLQQWNQNQNCQEILITSAQSRPLVSDGSLTPRLFNCPACSYICYLNFSCLLLSVPGAAAHSG